MNNFWENRYQGGGNSGDGSYGEYANHKAEVINNIIMKHQIKSISDFGCGDGNQISLLTGFEKYDGFDVSEFIIKQCQEKFKEQSVMTFHNDINEMPEAELSLSLDVIYHIIDEDDYVSYLKHLFNKSSKYVLIFSSNHNRNDSGATHIYHRKFIDWVGEHQKEFMLVEEIENFLQTSAKFYLFERKII